MILVVSSVCELYLKSSRKKPMRKIIEKQLKFGQVDISKIELDPRSRDEIPQLLAGLQAIYTDRQTRNNVFAILADIIPDNTDAGNGRPGMDLWSILVLGTLRLNCNWDYDKVLEIANGGGPQKLDNVISSKSA